MPTFLPSVKRGMVKPVDTGGYKKRYDEGWVEKRTKKVKQNTEEKKELYKSFF